MYIYIFDDCGGMLPSSTQLSYGEISQNIPQVFDLMISFEVSKVKHSCGFVRLCFCIIIKLYPRAWHKCKALAALL